MRPREASERERERERRGDEGEMKEIGVEKMWKKYLEGSTIRGE